MKGKIIHLYYPHRVERQAGGEYRGSLWLVKEEHENHVIATNKIPGKMPNGVTVYEENAFIGKSVIQGVYADYDDWFDTACAPVMPFLTAALAAQTTTP